MGVPGGVAATAVLVCASGARAADGDASWTLAPAFGVGYLSSRTGYARTGYTLERGGVSGRLSISLTYGALLRFGVRATGLLVVSDAEGVGGGSVVAVARLGRVGFIELGAGAGFARSALPTRAGTGAAWFGQAGIRVTPAIAVVAAYDGVGGRPGLHAFTAGIDAALGDAEPDDHPEPDDDVELVPTVAFGLGHGGAHGLPLIANTGLGGGLGFGLTYGSSLRFGARARGALKPPVRGGRLIGAVAVMPVARIGRAFHIEAGVGAGYTWTGGPGSDLSGAGVAATVEVGAAIRPGVSVVLAFDHITETPGWRAFTAGLRWRLSFTTRRSP